jgi:hypothetical protein
MFEERKIVIGLITSTEFIKQIQDRWDIKLLASPTAKRMAAWCMEYYSKYKKAPMRDIESIFEQKKKNGLPTDLAEEIEEDILPGLSDEYINENVNVDYLVTITTQYFNERHLQRHTETIIGLLSAGKLIEAQKEASSFKPISVESNDWVDLSNPNVHDKIRKAFNQTREPLIKFKGALGKFWNDQLYRGAFVSLMAPEKRGKTYCLLEFGINGCENNKRVAFFQAGDMDEGDQLLRISNRLTKKSEQEKYSGWMYEPIKDCIHNQTDSCRKAEREDGNEKIFNLPGNDAMNLRKTVTAEQLRKATKDYPDHSPCKNCKAYSKNQWATPWLRYFHNGSPLTEEEASIAVEDFFIKYKRQFRLSTHSNGSLSVKGIEDVLDIWEEQDGFIPDIIIVDYADLLVESSLKEFRHQQNKIWRDLRGVSQKRKVLLITATQTDANSYSTDLLKLDNFSEEKRKYGHVTAMYGLNQDHHGREKEIGIMRINEILLRKGDFNTNNQVHVLMNLSRGMPFLASYW